MAHSMQKPNKNIKILRCKFVSIDKRRISANNSKSSAYNFAF
ncbi:hypothetical protein BHF72_1052 [Cloacibacterium normanense]|uniref:Uncharacterized protein n=1 Tax=Cloacibacterium normanense TaxID=237258 RepID=A0A1E5UHG9_9FLAO|nr:hypothetical protein BHF72_1052 [Cloacibacterium normanense]